MEHDCRIRSTMLYSLASRHCRLLCPGCVCVSSPCWCVLSVHPCIVVEKKEVNIIYILLSSEITESTRWRDKAHQIPNTIYRGESCRILQYDSSHDIYGENKTIGSPDGRADLAS